MYEETYDMIIEPEPLLVCVVTYEVIKYDI